MPRQIVEWRVEEPLFIERMAVDMALTAAENAIVPADPRLVAVELERTFELYGLPANWEAIADFYLEAFEDVPLDLVQLACKRLRRSPLRFFPKPGEIRAHIIDDLRARNDTLRKVRLAQTCRRDPEPERPRLTEAEIRRVDQTVAKTLTAIATRAAATFYDEALPLGGGRDPAHRPLEREPTSAAKRKRIADELAGFRPPGPNDPGVLARLREMGAEPAPVDPLKPERG